MYAIFLLKQMCFLDTIAGKQRLARQYGIMGIRVNFCIHVVVVLIYIHGKQLGRSVNLTTLLLGKLRPPKRLTSTSCTYFLQLLKSVLLESAERETKVCGRTGYQTRDLWLVSQTRYRLRYAARPFYHTTETMKEK